MDSIVYIIAFLIQIVIVVASITIHEFSHGYSAFLLGDDTAKRAGRLTLNPIRHLDPIGALMLLIVRIGWAKPVPINPYNFKDQKLGTSITAAAGPASNFTIAIIFAVFYRMLQPFAQGSLFLYFIVFSFQFTVMINIALGLFNLIPIPPLDGSKIISGFLSDEAYFKWMQWEKQGAYLLMLIFGISFFLKIPLFQTIIVPPLNFFTKLLLGT